MLLLLLNDKYVISPYHLSFLKLYELLDFADFPFLQVDYDQSGKKYLNYFLSNVNGEEHRLLAEVSYKTINQVKSGKISVKTAFEKFTTGDIIYSCLYDKSGKISKSFGIPVSKFRNNNPIPTDYSIELEEQFESETTQLTAYHAKYFSYEITKRSSSDSIQKLATSLVDAQVDLNPHQVDAALFAFQSPLSKGAILADEVGLGKTIEAGLVISQKWAERKKKILIIVPSSLRKQWYQELQDKFFLPSLILESRSFNMEVNKSNLNPFEQKDAIVICSYHFAKARAPYIKIINWDLVIIDEAHRLRNVYKPQNKIANTIKDAVFKDKKILLTATPLQNSLMELYGLVSVIDEYSFGDLKSFKTQFSSAEEGGINFEDLRKRLEPICKRTLRRQVKEYVRYTNRLPIVEPFEPNPKEEQLYNFVSDYLQRENLYALPASQRQLMTLILRRLLASSTFAISGTLEALANKLDTIIKDQQEKDVLEEKIAENFETFDELVDEWKEEEEDETEQKEEKHYSKEDIEKIKSEISDLREFEKLAKSIIENSKGKHLLTALKKGFEEIKRLGGNKKAMIFTESTRTQIYLRDILEQTEYKGKIVLFNGTNNDPKSKEIYKNWIEKYKGTDMVTGSRTADMRAGLVEYFNDEAEIMIATEAAAEGINLQFCSLLVNYDLPWNPQKIEQRIGRCHRYGQKHDVVVVNFLNTKNEVDKRVFQLLDEKFQLFSGVFGASDEVLGAIESGVDFEKRIASIYQNCRTTDEIQKSFDELQKELEQKISESITQTKQKLLENFDEEVHEKLRINLQQSKEYLDKYQQLLWQISKFYLLDFADFNEKEYSFLLKKNPFPEKEVHPGPYRIGKKVDDSNVYRIGHPLAQEIIERCKTSDTQAKELVFNYSSSKKKISILENLVGDSGWLNILNFTIDSFETEDRILFCGVTDDGVALGIDQCQRLFSLPSGIVSNIPALPEVVTEKLKEISHSQEIEYLNESMKRNEGFFMQEMEKLEKWSDDLKTSLELEIKQLDKDIKGKKTEARKILKLEDKVKAYRDIKDMEKKRNELRSRLFQSQDDVEGKKDKLIEEVEARLKQKISKTELFTIRWKVV